MATVPHLIVELRAPQAAEPAAPPWAGLLKILGAVVAAGSWVTIVGGAVLWVRLDQVDVTPTPAVALIPSELMVAVGIRALVGPLVAGLVAFALLLLFSSLGGSESVKEQTVGAPAVQLQAASRGQQPHGLKTVLAILWLGLFVAAIAAPLAAEVVVAVAIGGGVVVVMGYLFVVASSGTSAQAAALFAVSAFAGGVFALVVEAGKPAKLDLAVAVRQSGATIPGYFLGRSDDQLLLVTASSQVATGRGEAGAVPSALTNTSPTCTDADIRSGGEDCYVQQLTSIPVDDVARFMIGPRGVEVGPAGFRAARTLAKRAALGADEYKPPEGD